MEVDWEAVRRQYFEQLAPADVHAGARLVGQLVSGGSSVDATVREVLRPAQIEVGRRWQCNEWTVADEHAASAVTEAALMAAAVAANPTSSGSRPQVVLACALDEWHTLPLRMVAEVITEAGYRPLFLGPSVPPLHLRDYLQRSGAMALLLSCSSALSLEGARECIAAAHAAGVPVVAGGRGFGPDDHRATLAGGDAWADDPGAALEVLARWTSAPPLKLAVAPALRGDPFPAESELMVLRHDVVRALRAAFPRLSAYNDRQWARTLEDIDSIVRFASLALRYRDARIFDDFAAWLADVLGSRQVPAAVLPASLAAVADALDGSRPAVAECVRGPLKAPATDAALRTA